MIIQGELTPQQELELQKASKRFEEGMKKYPYEEQIAVGLIAKNIHNGCSWEFVRNNPEVKRAKPDFDQSQTCNLIKVKNGYICTITMNRILEILNKEARGILTPQELKEASEHRQEAIVALDAKMKKGYKGRIGIFCTNDSTSITIKGTTFPAFAVTFNELLTVCIRNNYGLVLGALRTPTETSAIADKVIQQLDMAPSGNALLIDIMKM